MRQLQVYQRFPPSQDRRVLHGTMAAALAAPVLVALLDIVSLFILFYKTWKHNGTGFRQGPLTTSKVVCFYTQWVCEQLLNAPMQARLLCLSCYHAAMARISVFGLDDSSSASQALRWLA